MTTTTVPAFKRSNVFRRLGNDTQYVLIGFPLGIASLVLTVTLFSVGAGMLVTVVGLPIMVAALYVARGLGVVERFRTESVLEHELPQPQYKRAAPGAGFFRKALVPLTDSQSWLDLLHSVLRLIPSTIAFSVVVTWWAGALGGLTAPVWDHFIPYGSDSRELSDILGFGHGAGPRVAIDVIGGVFFALTLIPMVRGAALLEARFAQALLNGVTDLRERTRV